MRQGPSDLDPSSLTGTLRSNNYLLLPEVFSCCFFLFLLSSHKENIWDQGKFMPFLNQFFMHPAKMKWKKIQCDSPSPERRLGHTSILIYGQVCICCSLRKSAVTLYNYDVRRWDFGDPVKIWNGLWVCLKSAVPFVG